MNPAEAVLPTLIRDVADEARVAAYARIPRARPSIFRPG
jgi:hypothetical protein